MPAQCDCLWMLAGHTPVGIDDGDMTVIRTEPEGGRGVLRHRSEMPDGGMIESVSPGADLKSAQSIRHILCACGFGGGSLVTCSQSSGDPRRLR